MDTIERGLKYIFVIQVVIFQVSSHQQPIAQYVLSNYGHPNSYGPTQSVIPQSAPLPLPLPTIAPTQKPLPPSKPMIPKPESNGPLDSNVLNNLAIALQLLIVSNLLNMPEKERLSKIEFPSNTKLQQSNEVPIPYSAIQQYLEQVSKSGSYAYEAQLPKTSVYYDIPKPSLYYETSTLPNANFLGSSGFSEPAFGSLGTARPNPRTGMTLMSPYDALGTSSFSDPISFPSSYSKKDFQNPYASIMAADGARDLFSIADFF